MIDYNTIESHGERLNSRKKRQMCWESIKEKSAPYPKLSHKVPCTSICSQGEDSEKNESVVLDVNNQNDDDDEEEDAGAGDDPHLHQMVDLMHEGSGTDFVPPYFLTALAMSPNHPMQFNFDLCLLDDLCLPCEPVSSKDTVQLPSGQKQPASAVTFASSQEALTYCEERLKKGWLVEGRAKEKQPSDSGCPSHPRLDKEHMFHQEGKCLKQLLASGVAKVDAGLDKVRLDR